MRSARVPTLAAVLLAAKVVQAQAGAEPTPPATTPPAPAAPAQPAAAPPAPTAPAQPAAAPEPRAPDAPAPVPEGAQAPVPTPAPAPDAAPPAEPSEDGVSKFVVVKDQEPEPPLVPSAADRLTGHFSLAAGAGVTLPFGELEEGTSHGDLLDPGWMFSANAAFGLSRTFAVGVWGQYVLYGSPDECEDCDGSGFAVGPFVRYHLVQGVRFDPWALLGLGYRSTSVSGAGSDLDFSGIEWLHVEVGGDWYPTSTIGLGPYLGFDWGIYGDHPDDARDSASHFQVTTGLRLNLDVPGK